jgi:hypothetical protein
MGVFDDLSDYDFELLVADLLGKELSRRFETFPRGRDGGVDLRANTGHGYHLVQCKHYVHSGFSRLQTAARAEHAILAASARPKRYSFVTSRRLTKANKERLVAALRPYVRDERDVIGGEDLEGMLRRHPEVERAHVKLWLRSLAPLDHIINADVRARSQALVADIIAALPRYVQTRSFADARKLLSEHNVVIIAGPPGVGKTTLARLLLLDSAHAGYSPYAVQSDINDAWRIERSEEAQVFFFDDFLGRTALFDVVQEDPRDLATFIRKVRRSKTTRLVLATREYILQQARRDVEDLRWQELDAKRYALTLDRYSRFDRARIFYNHIFFSPQVDERARHDLLHDRAYLNVIDHPSYSPRLIEWMTGLGGHNLDSVERRDYAAYCVSVLDDPTGIWSHAYHQGLREPERCALLQLAALPPVVTLPDLERSYQSAAKVRGLPPSRSVFEASIKVIQDSFVTLHPNFIRREGKRGPDLISVLNPSLIDFLKARLLDDPAEITRALEAACFFEQVEFLHDLTVSDKRLNTEEFVIALSAAAERTAYADSPARPDPSGYTTVPKDVAHIPSRLGRLARWCERDPSVKRLLQPFIERAVNALLAELPAAGGSALMPWKSLLSRLQRAGLPFLPAASVVKRCALTYSHTVVGFEILTELRQLNSDLFSLREWADLQDQFIGRATTWLHEGPDWFADLDELYDLEQMASTMDVTLSAQHLERARERITEAVEQREADAAEDIDHERDYDEGYYVVDDSEYVSEDAHIDALFGMLED